MSGVACICIVLALCLCGDGLRVPSRHRKGWTTSNVLEGLPRRPSGDVWAAPHGSLGRRHSNPPRRDDTSVDTPSDSVLSSFYGLVGPVDSFLDSSWLFRYADLSNVVIDVPRNVVEGEPPLRGERTLIGVLFLMSNIPYIVVGQMIAIRLEMPLEGILLTLAGVLSCLYHLSQLMYGPNRIEVRRFLLFDYTTALNACFIFFVDALDVAFPLLSDPVNVEGGLPFITGAMALLALWRSAIAESNGRMYIFWHSIWHLLGACTAYLVGTAHSPIS